MKIVTNEQIASLITMEDAIATMRAAFFQFNQGGEMQPRVRIGKNEIKLSMMGAILPGLNVSGAKIYTTLNGRFTFVVVLFSNSDGKILAVMEGESMTGFRTAAVTAIATDHLARKDARTLAVFGTGFQARAHVSALLQVRKFSRILVVGIEGCQAFSDEIERQYGIDCRVVNSDQAVTQAEVILTATRSDTPLFSGDLLRPGTFVAAIGSSKPSAREIDDVTLRRARGIVVEWLPQAKAEAGDLLLAAPDTFRWDHVIELPDVVSGARSVRDCDDDVIVYKAVGVGMEDVALAELIYRRSQNPEQRIH